MSETPKKLPLDAALREWPLSEKPAAEWEEMARTIDARVRAFDAGNEPSGVLDEKLLADPLGQIEGEGHNSAGPVKAGETSGSKGETMTMPADRERDRRSLQDLAKLAGQSMTPPPMSVRPSHPSGGPISGVSRPPEAGADDSGMVDLAMASQADPHAAARAQATPLASDGLFDDEPASIRPPPAALSSAPGAHQLQQPIPSIPPFASPSMPPASMGAAFQAPVSSVPGSYVPNAPTSVQSSAQQAIAGSPGAKKKSGAIIALVLGGVVAVSAIAAGGLFFVNQRKAAHEPVAATTPAAPVAAPVVAAAPVETAQAATPAPEPTLDPNALPAAPDTKVAVAHKGGARPATAAKAAPAAPAAPKEEAAKLSQKDLPTAPAGPEGDLGKAMGKAVGADGKPVDATPASGNTGPQFAAGTVPQKPSQGAVTGAIGAVLPGARACLGPDDPVSRAAITFTSAGTVQSVSVSGGAAGKPAEACIKSALMTAKVAPFAEATYTAPITIRH